MARYWCVNFDKPEVLQRGLEEHFWAMQYQYCHGGHIYQGSPQQRGATRKNLKAVCEIDAGDWLVAYLKPNTFYAVGEAIEPRQRDWQLGKPHYEDSIERTVNDQAHRILDGIVLYTSETRVFYEDFTDPWALSGVNRYSGQCENWKYPQRIEVHGWEFKCAGVQVTGMAQAVAFPLFRLAVFEIPAPFFQTVLTRLRT